MQNCLNRLPNHCAQCPSGAKSSPANKAYRPSAAHGRQPRQVSPGKVAARPKRGQPEVSEGQNLPVTRKPLTRMTPKSASQCMALHAADWQVGFLRSVTTRHKPAPLMLARFPGLLLPAHPATFKVGWPRGPLYHDASDHTCFYLQASSSRLQA